MNWTQLKNPALRAKFEAIAALTEAELAALGLKPRHRDDFLRDVQVSECENDCWGWRGGVTKNGRKLQCITKNNIYAYRVSYALFTRTPMSKVKVVRHVCPGEENPMCCNPRHLRNGTQAENHADMRRYGTLPTGDRNGSRTHPESRPCGTKHSKAGIKDPKIVQTIRATWDSAVDKNGLIATLARYLDLKECVVSSVVNHRGRGYAEIPDDISMAIPLASLDIWRPEDRAGDSNGRSRIPEEAVCLLYRLYRRKLTRLDRRALVRFVAKRYGMAEISVGDIGRGDSRRRFTEPLDASIDRDEKLLISTEFLEEAFAKFLPLRKGRNQ